MPPAFNLSQDQTLQFNPSKSLNRRWPHPNPKASASKSGQDFLRVSTPSFLRPNKTAPAIPPRHQATPAPTLIGCNLLKNRPDKRANRGQTPENTGKEARLYNVSSTGQQPAPMPRLDRTTPPHSTGREAAAGQSGNLRHWRYGFAMPCPPLLECPRHANRSTCDMRFGAPCPASVLAGAAPDRARRR